MSATPTPKEVLDAIRALDVPAYTITALQRNGGFTIAELLDLRELTTHQAGEIAIEIAKRAIKTLRTQILPKANPLSTLLILTDLLEMSKELRSILIDQVGQVEEAVPNEQS